MIPEQYVRLRLGEMLVGAGAISEEELEEALEVQRREGGRLGRILVDQQSISEEQLAETIAEQQGLTLVDLDLYDVDISAPVLIESRFAQRHHVLPIGYEDGELVCAMVNPLDIQTIDSLATITGRKIRPVVVTESALAAAIDRYLQSGDETFDEAVQAAVAQALPTTEEAYDALAEDVPVVRLVNRILTEAAYQGASDIHIEPQENQVRVRFRVDGVLHEFMTLPKAVQAALVSRIKIISDLDIAERRQPQDGRTYVSVSGRQIDVRVAILPTPYGENVTLRLLSKDFSLMGLEELGLRDAVLEQFMVALGKPYGAVLVCGPTGAGKTTTLYAAVHAMNTIDRKIITIEDPVEYRIAGITQIQVNNRIDLSFAKGLRSILRSDPDVVLVGEMRDPETAQIAVRGAMTGHLVLSSLHTNDAPSALIRLVDVGVPPFLVPGAIVAIAAQRLVRRLCPNCREPYKGETSILKEAGVERSARTKPTFYRPKGCDQCFGTGYKGRLGCFELIQMTPELGSLCVQGASTEEIRRVAIQQGMQTMRQDAICKVADGLTSLEEVARVLG